MPLIVITGTDRYLCQMVKKSYRGKVDMPEFNEVYFDKWDDDRIREYIETFPFMSDRKVCFVDVPKLSEIKDSKILSQLMTASVESVDVILSLDYAGVNPNLKIYKGLKAAGVCRVCDKITSSAKMRQFIEKWCSKHGTGIDGDACEELIRRVNYFNRDDVDLFGVVRALEDCRAVRGDQRIDRHTVEVFVADNEKDNCTMLIRGIDRGDINAVCHQAQLMLDDKSGSALGVLGMMRYHFKVAFKRALFGENAPVGSGVSKNWTEIRSRILSALKECLNTIESAYSGITSGKFGSDETAVMFTAGELIDILAHA